MLADVKGPVRDVLRRAGLWDRLDGRISATPHQAVETIRGRRTAPDSLRGAGIDEHDLAEHDLAEPDLAQEASRA